MGVLALFASRFVQAVRALGAAVVGGLLWWPELVLQPVFALPVAANWAIVWLRDSGTAYASGDARPARPR